MELRAVQNGNASSLWLQNFSKCVRLLDLQAADCRSSSATRDWMSWARGLCFLFTLHHYHGYFDTYISHLATMLHWAMNRTTPPQVPFLPVGAKAVSMVGPHSTPLVRSLMMNWPCTFWVLLVWSFCRSHRFSGWSTWTEEEDKQDLLSQSGVVLAPSAICSCWYKKTINGVFGTGLLTCGEKKFRFPVRKVFVICAVEKALGS